MDNFQHRFLVSRWIAEEMAGVISEEERTQLEAWRKEASANEEEYQELRRDYRQEILTDYPEKEIGREWERFQKQNRYSVKVVRLWYRYAALIVLLLGVGGFLKWQLDKGKKPEKIAGQTISMAQGCPLLILADGKSMTLDDSVLLSQEIVLNQILVRDSLISYRQQDGETGTEEACNTLIIPKGGEFQIQLADGSHVWLNSETELRYPVHFAGAERRVYLKGEAYFEVAKNVEKPFIVTTSGGIDVRVLGTKFNVASYDNDEQVTTTLAEGCVEVGNKGSRVKLQPDEQALFDKKNRSFQVQKVDAAVFLAWKDGRFLFEEQSLEQIMKQLQRWYEMTVFFTSEEIKKYTFSGDLKKYDDFDKIIRMLEEVAGIKISIKGNCVVIGAK